MSDQQSAKPSAPRPAHSPWVTVLLILIGIVLLLPGLCSLIFSVVWLRNMLFDPGYRPGELDGLGVLIMLACAAIGAGGVGVIVFAIRR
jgi:hypothetical protein